MKKMKTITLFFLSGLLMITLFICCTDNGEGKEKGYRSPSKDIKYKEEFVRIENKADNATLAGTLVIPQSNEPVPAVILLSGSGFQDRDETVYGHKPFKVIADFLSSRGIAVLRYDDRSIGGSTGDIYNATIYNFSADALAALEYLKKKKQIDPEKIGLIGHSEGALVASIAASESDDVSFIIMMSGLGIPWFENSYFAVEHGLNILGKSDEIIKANQRLMRIIYDVVKKGDNTSSTERSLNNEISRWRNSLTGEVKKEIDSFTRNNSGHWEKLANQFAEPPYRFYASFDPASVLIKVKCPILALCGEKDVQISADENLKKIEQIIKESGNTNYEIHKLKDHNHLLQRCETGLTSEYSEIEESFSPVVLEMIYSWINRLAK
ncbi:alpha/beta hydrolase family protein [Candidatus Latescibacterota bacterium]